MIIVMLVKRKQGVEESYGFSTQYRDLDVPQGIESGVAPVRPIASGCPSLVPPPEETDEDPAVLHSGVSVGLDTSNTTRQSRMRLGKCQNSTCSLDDPPERLDSERPRNL